MRGYGEIHSSFGSQSLEQSCSGLLPGGSAIKNAKSRTDVDDIHDLIEDALALSAKAQSVVEAIIGGRGICTDGCAGQPVPSGILSRIGDRSRDARNSLSSASDELERLARAFGV